MSWNTKIPDPKLPFADTTGLGRIVAIKILKAATPHLHLSFLQAKDIIDDNFPGHIGGLLFADFLTSFLADHKE